MSKHEIETSDAMPELLTIAGCVPPWHLLDRLRNVEPFSDEYKSIQDEINQISQTNMLDLKRRTADILGKIGIKYES